MSDYWLRSRSHSRYSCRKARAGRRWNSPPPTMAPRLCAVIRLPSSRSTCSLWPGVRVFTPGRAKTYSGEPPPTHSRTVKPEPSEIGNFSVRDVRRPSAFRSCFHSPASPEHQHEHARMREPNQVHADPDVAQPTRELRPAPRPKRTEVAGRARAEQGFAARPIAGETGPRRPGRRAASGAGRGRTEADPTGGPEGPTSQGLP